jgi:hypothetical protein
VAELADAPDLRIVGGCTALHQNAATRNLPDSQGLTLGVISHGEATFRMESQNKVALKVAPVYDAKYVSMAMLSAHL